MAPKTKLSEEKLAQQAAKTTKSIIGNFKKYTQIRHPHIDMIMDEQNVNVWDIRFRDFSGNNDEFEGGEYLLQVKAPSDYPFKPPEFYFLTTNGGYNLNCNVCISIGEYHSDSWPAALGMGGMTGELLNGLISWHLLGGGINIINTTIEDKKKFAAASREWNRKHHKALIDKFENLPHNVMYKRTERLNLSPRTLFLIRRYLGVQI